MNRKAWIYQDVKQVSRVGAGAASWYVGWIDPAGKRRCKSCGPGSKGKQLAERLADKRHAELVTGTYDATATAKTWAQFRLDYEARVFPRLAKDSASTYRTALDFFESISKPAKVSAITTATIDQFAAKRLASGVAPATVNRDLHGIRRLISSLAIALAGRYVLARVRCKLGCLSTRGFGFFTVGASSLT